MQNPLIQIYPLPDKDVVFNFEEIEKMKEEYLKSNTNKISKISSYPEPDKAFTMIPEDPTNLYPLPEFNIARTISQKFSNKLNQSSYKSDEKIELSENVNDSGKADVEKNKLQMPYGFKDIGKINEFQESKAEVKKNLSPIPRVFIDTRKTNEVEEENKAIIKENKTSMGSSYNEKDKIKNDKDNSIILSTDQNHKSHQSVHPSGNKYTKQEVDLFFENSKYGSQFVKTYQEFEYSKTFGEKLCCVKINDVKKFRKLNNQGLYGAEKTKLISQVGRNSKNFENFSILGVYIILAFQGVNSDLKKEQTLISPAIEKAITIFESRTCEYESNKDYNLLFYICVKEFEKLNNQHEEYNIKSGEIDQKPLLV